MRVHLKLNGKYCGVDPTPVRGKSGDAAFPVYADRAAGGSWEEVELTVHDGGQFDARFVAANRQLSIQPDGSLESREAGAIGSYELPFATQQPDGAAIAYRIDGDRLIPGVLQIEAVAS